MVEENQTVEEEQEIVVDQVDDSDSKSDEKIAGR